MSNTSSKHSVEISISNCVLILAALLRIILGYYNYVANDDHLEVSRYFLQGLNQGYFPPEFQSCWECYHAKLYHYVCALLFYIFEINNHHTQLLLGQFLNVVAGVFTILAVGSFLRQLGIAWPVRVCAFALAALNPSLIAINIQATNDSLVILFGVLTTYWLLIHVRENDLRSLVFCVCFLIFALLTKGSALFLIPVVFLSLLVQALKHIFNGTFSFSATRGLIIASFALIFVGLMPPSVSPYRQYFERMWSQSSFAAVNFEKNVRPYWFKKTFVGRPGVTSISDSYFSFRFFDMLNTPYINQDKTEYPLHRTSLWSQLYGRYHFIFFDQWPWEQVDRFTLWLGRISLALGAIPTLIFIFGLSIEFVSAGRRIFCHNWKHGLGTFTWVLPFESILFTALIVIFTLEHRGFESMKIIYVLPAYLAFLSAYTTGLTRLLEMFSRHQRTVLFLYLSQILMIVVYCFNSVALLQYLIAK